MQLLLWAIVLKNFELLATVSGTLNCGNIFEATTALRILNFWQLCRALLIVAIFLRQLLLWVLRHFELLAVAVSGTQTTSGFPRRRSWQLWSAHALISILIQSTTKRFLLQHFPRNQDCLMFDFHLTPPHQWKMLRHNFSSFLSKHIEGHNFTVYFNINIKPRPNDQNMISVCMALAPYKYFCKCAVKWSSPVAQMRLIGLFDLTSHLWCYFSPVGLWPPLNSGWKKRMAEPAKIIENC